MALLRSKVVRKEVVQPTNQPTNVWCVFVFTCQSYRSCWCWLRRFYSVHLRKFWSEIGDWRLVTGDRRLETRDRRQETGDRRTFSTVTPLWVSRTKKQLKILQLHSISITRTHPGSCQATPNVRVRAGAHPAAFPAVYNLWKRLCVDRQRFCPLKIATLHHGAAYYGRPHQQFKGLLQPVEGAATRFARLQTYRDRKSWCHGGSV